MKKVTNLSKKVLGAIFLASSLTSGYALGNSIPVVTEVFKDFSDVAATVDGLISKHGGDSVLFVTDLDNTALVLNSDMGSEQWFLWQKDLITSAPTSRGTAARNIEELLDVQSRLYALSTSRPNEEAIPANIQRWQSHGVRTMALTSRSTSMRDYTVKDLKTIGIQFGAKTLEDPTASATEYLPYDLNQIEQSGLTHDDAVFLKLPTAKAVIFDRGVFLTNGQNKGAMLRTILHRSGFTPKAIVFIDDRPHHVAAVAAAFGLASAPEVEVVSIQYIHAKPAIDSFNSRNKAVDIAEWCAIAHGMQRIFFAGIAEDRLPFMVCKQVQ